MRRVWNALADAEDLGLRRLVERLGTLYIEHNELAREPIRTHPIDGVDYGFVGMMHHITVLGSSDTSAKASSNGSAIWKASMSSTDGSSQRRQP